NPNAKEFGGGPGRGIAQWSTGGRWDTDTHDNMTWYANQHGRSKWSLDAQLDFVWYELHDHGGYGLSALKNTSTIAEATVVVEKSPNALFFGTIASLPPAIAKHATPSGSFVFMPWRRSRTPALRTLPSFAIGAEYLLMPPRLCAM